MKILLVTNSDFGVRNTIGYRATPIAKKLYQENKLEKVICRDCQEGILPNKFIVKVFPLGNLIPKILSGFEIYISKALPIRKIQIALFEFFSRKYIKNADIIHSWEYSGKLNLIAKEKGRNIHGPTNYQAHYHGLGPS